MSPSLVTLATLLAALGAGLVAGVFFAFSTFVMRALADLPPAQGAAAMQRINVVVINPWVMGALFGTGLACLAVVVAALLDRDAAGAGLRLAGGILYLAGTLGVTIAGNVPLNERLAPLPPDEASRFWPAYARAWTRWNHVRGAAALAAAALLILAFGAG